MGSSHGKFSSNRDESVKASLITKSGLNREVAKGIEDQKEENSSTMRKRLNPRLSRGVPKGLESELVAAGWPKWLVDVASEALIGWLPRTPDTFEKIHKIGQGSYSNVYKARDCLLNKIVVLKKVCADNLDPGSFKFMAREIVLLRRLGDHPNVIKLEGVVPSKMACSLVFDCMEYDLKGIQEQKGVKLSEPEIKCYMNQLLKGLDHCHSRGILHRDVKTSNLLVNKDGILKIADFGLSTFFDPEQSIPLTNIIGTLWYRPPELLLGLNHYGVGVDLWGVGCVLGELFTGKPIMPGKTEFEQLYYIFKLCGSPSDECWLKSDLPNASILKPQMPYRRQIQATFHDLPAAAVGLMDTLLSIEPEYRGTAALALQGEFFTSEPFACDPLSLPRCPPRNEMDAKETKMIREFNAGLQRSVDRRRLRNRLEKTNEKVSGGVLNEATDSYTQRSATTHQSDNQRDLLRECNDMILKAVTCGRLEKGLIAKVNVHDSNGKKSHSVGPSTNMQGLPRKHWTMFDTEKKAEGEGNNSKLEKNQLIEQLLPPAESDGLNFLEDNHYCGPLSSTSKPIDVDRILREHDRQIQESVERAKQQKKLGKAQF
ncbi:probable serine/threonine-protein kinase At1g54610 [Solanum verrucosum]|uniref:probable serine/threonine-protein kinase At1g54610 n=1 Tax=Solanum verrucosum TaxID=315347 RepID=UPI0020D10A49|nr:probable serine/threonine-protein kinase At1g54610 [Solanum verrucosum]